MTIGELIHSQRKKLDLTLEDVGQYCNVPRSTVSRWERGEIQKIKRDKVEKLCVLLNIDPVLFFRPAEILTKEEYDLLDAFRNADKRAKEDAMKMLLEHPLPQQNGKELAI